jgi:hypothetical protein
MHARCNFGFRALVPVGGVTRTCMQGGVWSGDTPVCSASTATPTKAPTVSTMCPIATPPAHATMAITGPVDGYGRNEVGAKARFTCASPSFAIMHGPSQAECIISADLDVNPSATGASASPKWTPFPMCSSAPTLCSHMRCSLKVDFDGGQHISVLHHRREMNGNRHRCTVAHTTASCSCVCWTELAN